MLDVITLPLAALAMFGVKLGGYWAAGNFLAVRTYAVPPRPWAFAWSRALGGLVMSGVLVALAVLAATVVGGYSEVAYLVSTVGYFVAQLVMRFVLSFALVLGFFDRSRQQLQRDGLVALGLTAWSYVLDVPTYLLGVGELAFFLRDFRLC